MIRYIYINNLILQIYKKMPKIEFPINVQDVLKLIPNCRYLSYQTFAEATDSTIEDVINLCESKSGCTHYELKQDRYLILCNQSPAYNNNEGRQRWTLSHEIGHVLCEHLSTTAKSKLSENNLLQDSNTSFENEADYFAATLLAPFPLFKILNIRSVIDVQITFGLSAEAAQYRYKNYINWERNHWKSAWENDMINVYKSKIL